MPEWNSVAVCSIVRIRFAGSSVIPSSQLRIHTRACSDFLLPTV